MQEKREKKSKYAVTSTPESRELRRRQAVQMKATGHPAPEIATTLRVSTRTVDTDLAKPSSQEELALMRETARRKMLEVTSGQIVDNARGLIQKTLTDRDAKSFDAASRGLLNLEKVSSSASGEARKVEVNDVSAFKPTAQDLKDLINQVLGYSPGNSAKVIGAASTLVK